MPLGHRDRTGRGRRGHDDYDDYDDMSDGQRRQIDHAEENRRRARRAAEREDERRHADDDEDAPAPKARQKRPITGGKAFGLGLLASLLVASAAAVAVTFVPTSSQKSADEMAQLMDEAYLAAQDMREHPNITVDGKILKKCLVPSVSLAVTDNASNKTTYGSGIMITSDGKVVTNNHVVRGEVAIKATVGSETYDAIVAGKDPSSDIAVLKLQQTNGKEFDVVELPDGEKAGKVGLGDYVIGVGNPYGLNDTLSYGHVTALNRNIPLKDADGNDVMYSNMIQTDAGITPGTSGGALYDQNGTIIGMMTLVANDAGNTTTIGFALPWDYVWRIAQNLGDGDAARHAVLGVSTSDVPDEIKAKYGIEGGAYVQNVTNGGPAQGHIEVNDIIVSVGNDNVNTSQELNYAVRSMTPGERVKVTFLRGGSQQEDEITLGADA